MKILVTGGAGFIGSNFIHYLLNHYSDVQIINLDKLTYAGNLENLQDIEDCSSYSFIKGDIADADLVNRVVREGIEVIVNFAAESHVDRSIEDSGIFIKTNILGTQVLLESARRHKISRFIQISTDEVYGSLGPEGYFTENSPLAPRSPYAASKTGGDLLAKSYFETYRLPLIITRSSNNYGPYQFPEKLIPLFITNALSGDSLPLYGDGLNVRDWLQVEDNCRAIDLVMRKGKEGEVYNIGGNCEKTNLDITKIILASLNKPDSLIKYVKDRPGHDWRYALDTGKIEKELGWTPRYQFREGMNDTINWYIQNDSWWKKVKSGEYQEYYQKMYGNR